MLDALFDDETIEAVVRDGWPRAMVRAGFELHRRTWDLDALRTGLDRELAGMSDPPPPPRCIAHIWPALPGAGVAPVLLAHLLGVHEQQVRPSRRGLHFAARFAEVFPVSLDSEPDRYVVSGSDETVEHFCAQYGPERVVGYGDRQSFAVVTEDDCDHVAGLATDAVMWFGRGCFSLRAVLFVGSDAAAGIFAADLADAIATREAELLGASVSEGLLARRAQALGVAQFQTDVWPARLGWVERRERWDGAPREADVVVVCRCDEPRAALAVDPRHLQGVATPDPLLAAGLGATRICAPGALQAPEPDWPHDGVSNAAALLGLVSGRL